MNNELSNFQYKEGFLFNEKDFLLLFIHCLNNNGVTNFSHKEISDKLYTYKFEEKYKHLFENIRVAKYSKLDLRIGINDAKAWGYLKWVLDDLDKFSIQNGTDLKEYVRIIYSPMYIELMQQLVKDYLFYDCIEKQGRYKLTIYGINPNTKYSLIKGIHREIGVNWQIITDGTLVENNLVTKEPKDMNYCKDPQDKYDLIGLYNVTSRYVSIKGASFVIEQGRKGICDSKSILYTNIKEKQLLEKLADHSTRLYTPQISDAITSEEPYVYSLKI